MSSIDSKYIILYTLYDVIFLGDGNTESVN